MKTLFCYYLPSGGMETLNRQREKSLKIVNINTHFLYLQSGSGMKNLLDSKVFISNDNGEIKTLIKNERYDAIIVNSDANLLKRIRSFGFNGPLIFELQGLGTKSEANTFLKYVARANIENYSDALLYPKTPHLQQLTKEIFPNKKKFSFHNCIDTNVFSYKHKQQVEQYNYIIGWVGRIEKNKNWQDCLMIVNHLLQEFPNLELWMFIDDTLTTPSQKKAFEQKLRQLSMEKMVKMHHNIPHAEMPNYYSTIADSGGFVLSTSLTEGFGYAVLEAMSCKCPVLTSNSDGVQSFVFHNVTGKLYTHSNYSQAVNEARDLILNTTLRNKLTEHSAAFVKENFSLKQYANHFQAMLTELF
ncbi:glycosyltransferase family 4 protein [Pueribacillus sp. YX66]|uniref:glycosyltransferase family 4 protein n=1 Tax=Pueribacillus sp. YX66 TaxID=3229242 RepID=UPI00358CF088